MSIIELPRVNPGDIISSELMNRLVAELVALEARVEDLENAEETPTPQGKPILTRRQPEGDVRMEGILTFFGRNFAPLSGTSVTIGGQTITDFGVGSGDTRLSFQVPQFADERKVSATVSNGQGTSTPLTNIQLRRSGEAPPGMVVVEDHTPELGEIEAGEAYELVWRVRTTDRRPRPYTFDLALSEVFPINTHDEWAAAIELSSEGENISSGSPADVTAKVKVPDSKTATLTLRVTAPASVTSSATPITLAVGETPEVTDSRVQVQLLDQQPLNDAGKPNPVHRLDDAIEVEPQSSGMIDVNVGVLRDAEGVGTLSFSAELDDNSGGLWATGDVDPESRTIRPGGAATIHVPITNSGTDGSPPGPTELKVSAKDDDDLVSFTRIPIRSGDGS